ncbi:hypothetical protein NEHOM01_0415 [Nematocida homosporus]|uniref:uncharacterized protein n=1 Tax=Nematocida homosporus TaxID=1912981 RepID=UPI0022204D5E|nr:uncharacterized protein NEHOM01_0415 [Nematocida homosporus]KAI5184813.1 hypothetical protein NEHOM01_0415 [Nematocida homosporus]
MVDLKHTSLEDRLQSFRPWRRDLPAKKALAYTGFTNDRETPTNDAVICVYCQKQLEGWLPEEIPAEEHFRHSPHCILSTPHLIESRTMSFKTGTLRFLPRVATALATDGLFLYNLNKTSNDLFCYVCGFYCSLIDSRDRHVAVVVAIRKAHHAFSPHCRARRASLAADSLGNKDSLPTHFLYRLISLQVSPADLVHHELDLAQTPHTVVVTHRPQPNALKVSLAPMSAPSGPFSPPSDSPSPPASPQSSDSQTTASLSSDSSPRPVATTQTETETQTPPPTQPRATINPPQANPTILTPQATQTPQTTPATATVTPPDSVQAIYQVDPVVADLATFLSTEEKTTYTLKDSLRVGLSRMLAKAREVTDLEMEKTRAELTAIITNHQY